MTILILLAILPLASALAAILRDRRQMEAVYFASAAGAFAAAVWLAADVLREGSIALAGGFLYADSLSALVLLLTAFVYLIIAPYAIGYLRHDGAGARRMYFWLMPLFGFAMFLVAVANNLGVMWVAVEGTTLASIFLVTYYGRPTSLEAAWKYAIIGGVGLSMALFGTVLTYYSAHRVLGTESLSELNWSVLVQSAGRFDPSVMRLAFILVLLGYGTKAGLAPMHTWKPDAYSEAPVPVAALMATAVLNCALYALARFYVLTSACLGPGFASQLLVIFGLLTMGIAVPFILVQRSYRRLLAYSSIDHGGIMVLSLGFGGAIGALGMLLHMTFHSLTKPLLFFCAGNAQQHTGTDSMKRGPSGLLRELPITAPLFLMAALAVTGAPPFSMFQSEFTVLRAGFAAQHTTAVVLFVIFVAAIFCGFFFHISQLVWGKTDDKKRPPAQPERANWKTMPMVVLAAVVVLIALWLPAPLYTLIERAAQILAVRP
jgi:hydrogenase-4 component F